jgi:hypothetical protein
MGRTLKYLGVAVAMSLGPCLLTDAGAQPAHQDAEAKAAARKGRVNQNIDPDGEPSALAKSKTARYALWRDRDGWQLRTTSDRRTHRFKGQIRVEGGFIERVTSYRGEREKAAPHWKWTPKGLEVNFDFRSKEPLDGIRFRPSPNTQEVVFLLQIDGSDDTYQVLVGRKNQQPEVLPMALPAWPRQAKAGR